MGATGKQEDHTLGNISLLIDYMKAGAQVTMLTDHGMFIPASGAELFQVISRTANLHLQLQRHRTEGRWAGISAQ